MADIKRGFTLIEILMIVAITGLLTSVIYANLSDARAKARDNARVQQIRQIDHAVNLYSEQNGHAPDLQGTCGASSAGTLSNCTALSTAGSSRAAQQQAWSRFMQDIRPFMSQAPYEPCGSFCGQDTYNPLGYVYVAPAGMKELCGPDCEEDLDNYYQLYTTLENPNNPPQYGFGGNGSGGSGDFYVPPLTPSPDTIAPSVPQGVSATQVAIGGLKVRISWSPSTDTGGSGVGGYQIFRGATYIGFKSTTSKIDILRGVSNGQIYCWTIKAVDLAGNVSVASAPTCVNLNQQQPQ